jgi:hypothetical protein
MSATSDIHPFRAAWQTRDLDAWANELSPDVVAYSPMLTMPFAGRETLVELYGVFFQHFEDFEITHEFQDGEWSAFFWTATAKSRTFQGSDLIRLNAEGKVVEVTVLIRPLVGIAAFGAATGPPIARRRGILWAFLTRLISTPLGLLMRLVDVVAPVIVFGRR